MALSQSDLKSMVAYLSVTHMSSLAWLLFSVLTVGGRVLLWLVLVHGLVSPLLFFRAHLYLHLHHSRLLLFLQGLSTSTLLLTLLVLLLFLLLGVPPLLSFFSEVGYLSLAYSLSWWLGSWLASSCGASTLVSLGRVTGMLSVGV